MTLLDFICRVLVLDWDGVVGKTEGYLEENLEQAARFAGLPTRMLLDYIGLLKQGLVEMRSSLPGIIPLVWPDIKPEQGRLFAFHFREQEKRNPYPPCEGSIEALHKVHALGVPICIVTANEPEYFYGHRLPSLKLEDFPFAVVSTLVNGITKPDTRVLRPIFDAFPSVPSQEMVYVGDWITDCQVAYDSFMRFIAILSGFVPKHIFIARGVPEQHIFELLIDVIRLMLPGREDPRS